MFQIRNSNFTTNHGTIFVTCANAGGQETEVSSGTFVIGHGASFQLSMSCPAAFSTYAGKWRWTHTGSGDSAALISLVKGVDNQTGQTGLASVMARIGANPYVIANLGPGDTYSLVGSVSPGYKNAPPAVAVESSSLITRGIPEGGIRGILGRSNRFYYEPILSDIDVATQISHDLQIVAWQDPVDWPYSQTTREKAAYTYLSQHAACGNVSPDDPKNPCSNNDIRAGYTNSLIDPTVWNQ